MDFQISSIIIQLSLTFHYTGWLENLVVVAVAVAVAVAALPVVAMPRRVKL